MKVWMYYLDKELYAFTINKKFKEKFEFQRNMKCFERGCAKMQEPSFQVFLYKNKNKMMIEIPLSDETDNVTIIGTAKEEFELEEGMINMESEIQDIVSDLTKYPFKKKYNYLIKAISVLYRIETLDSKIPKTNEMDHINRTTINILSLFYNLFKNTFTKQED